MTRAAASPNHRRPGSRDHGEATLFGIAAERGAGTLWTSGAMDGAEPGLPDPLVARFR
ncbi:hypothetical protein [Amycolatopsis rifamycinica]|uniref:hypothetical protein n=1 Tax=Amycolatopsis rifamycinica TaxID=287986 RepID=UPI001363607C|nr:hypothetical protein [Amycolatopsis rifamycinica]